MAPFKPLTIISAIGYHGGHRSTGVLNNRSLIRHSGVHFARHHHRRRHSPPAVRTAPRRYIRYKRSQIKIPRPPDIFYCFSISFLRRSVFFCYPSIVSRFARCPSREPPHVYTSHVSPPTTACNRNGPMRARFVVNLGRKPPNRFSHTNISALYYHLGLFSYTVFEVDSISKIKSSTGTVPKLSWTLQLSWSRLIYFMRCTRRKHENAHAMPQRYVI